MELLEDLGEIPEALSADINNQKDIEILKKWHKVAAKAELIEDFEMMIGLVK